MPGKFVRRQMNSAGEEAGGGQEGVNRVEGGWGVGRPVGRQAQGG